MGRTCPYCNSSDIDEDAARGDATCMNCGTVLEESTIVSDVQFQERGGGHEVVGQFVSRDRAQTNTLMGVPGLARTESREVTFYKGKKLIQEVASQLRINKHCEDTAFNFFKMCVTRNFTRGRIRSHVVAACLYMTCRLENTSHLLLDFSDVTQVNVFDLGRTLNFLTRSLKINLPTTDPCLYVLRFAVMLDFGDKQKDVVTLATRIVQRMKRDWMSTGRRPTGLCGAALLLAAKAYNFRRSITDIVRVVHISEAVVRKRLDEFACTPSGSLTLEEFANVDLEESEDPPAFVISKRRARESQRRKEEDLRLEMVEREMGAMQREVEEALKQKMKKSPYGRLIASSLSDGSPELTQAETLIREEIIDTVYNLAEAEPEQLSPREQSERYGPSLESLGITAKHIHAEQVPQSSHSLDTGTSIDNDLDLEGIDDDEIDSYILSDVESNMKSKVWMARNADHLAEMERRRKLREEEEERERDNPKKRRIIRKKEPINAVSHNEAMYQVIQEKRLSNKINYDILKEIENDGKPDQNGNVPHTSDATSPFSPLMPSMFSPNAKVFPEERPSTSADSQVAVAVTTAAAAEVATPQGTMDDVVAAPVTPTADANASKSTLEEPKPTVVKRRKFGAAKPNLGKAGVR